MVEREKEIQGYQNEQKLPKVNASGRMEEVAVEEGCQGEALRKDAEKKVRKRRTAEKDK